MRLWTCPLLLLMAAAVGCKETPDDEGFREQLEAVDYRNFARAPGYESPRAASTAPHGDFVDIYMNDVVVDALANGPLDAPLDAWPDGSLIVKDGWGSADGDDWEFLAAMEKRDQQWFWAEYRGGDEVIYAALEDPTCTGCHDAGSDGVLAFTLP